MDQLESKAVEVIDQMTTAADCAAGANGRSGEGGVVNSFIHQLTFDRECRYHAVQSMLDSLLREDLRAGKLPRTIEDAWRTRDIVQDERNEHRKKNWAIRVRCMDRH